MPNFRTTLPALAALLFLVRCTGNSPSAETSQAAERKTDAAAITELAIKNLLIDSLGLAPDVEIIIDHLEIPEHTTLPAHYHPGEEFVYMMEGSGELTLNRETVITAKKGDLVKVPLKNIHSFSTGDEAVRAVVFRVHEKGQPHRVLVD